MSIIWRFFNLIGWVAPLLLLIGILIPAISNWRKARRGRQPTRLLLFGMVTGVALCAATWANMVGAQRGRQRVEGQIEALSEDVLAIGSEIGSEELRQRYLALRRGYVTNMSAQNAETFLQQIDRTLIDRVSAFRELEAASVELAARYSIRWEPVVGRVSEGFHRRIEGLPLIRYERPAGPPGLITIDQSRRSGIIETAFLKNDVDVELGYISAGVEAGQLTGDLIVEIKIQNRTVAAFRFGDDVSQIQNKGPLRTRIR